MGSDGDGWLSADTFPDPFASAHPDSHDHDRDHEHYHGDHENDDDDDQYSEVFSSACSKGHHKHKHDKHKGDKHGSAKGERVMDTGFEDAFKEIDTDDNPHASARKGHTGDKNTVMVTEKTKADILDLIRDYQATGEVTEPHAAAQAGDSHSPTQAAARAQLTDSADERELVAEARAKFDRLRFDSNRGASKPVLASAQKRGVLRQPPPIKPPARRRSASTVRFNHPVTDPAVLFRDAR